MRMNLLTAAAVVASCWVLHAVAQSDSSLPKLPQVDVTNVDTAMSPCTNFYQYVCGKINAAHPIPPDQVFWGPGEELQEWNRLVLRQILEKNEPANPGRSPNEQKIGDFYSSCRNQTGDGELTVLKPILDRIHAMKDKREIAAVLAMIHSSIGSAWVSSDNQAAVALLGYGPTADYNDVGRVVAGVDQGGLGMPGRDFYLKTDEDSKKIRDQYVTLVVALLKLGGESEGDATKNAATILRIETAMARAQMDNVSRRDPNKVNNRYTLAELKKLTPAFDWDAYQLGLNAPEVPLYEVSAPEFFKALNQLLTDEPLETWKVYLRFHVLGSAADVLGKPWRDASFEFQSAVLGLKEQPPEWRRCTIAVDHYLGEALGQVYVAQVFPPESKARALKMVKDIESAMGRDIDSVSWMQPATRKEAHLKLAAVMEKIGYPDKWIDYSTLSVSRDSYLSNVERATTFELKRQLAFIGHPLDRTQWLMTPPTLNAYEDPQTNTINFPAGILQPPFFDPSMDDAINYGAEGGVIGHELTHDFDDQGRKFDVKGNLRDWWTAQDAKEYEQRGSCIAKEYTGPVPGIAGVEQDGKLTQGEDTADNGGLYLALSALVDDLKQQGKTLDDKDGHGLTNLQRFFMAYATSWCDQVRPEAARTLILTNPHSIPFLRVNNVLANMPEFQKTFGCKQGDAMVHRKQCRVW
jgi:putative endopeptidase